MAALGARIGELGITPAISPFVPSTVVDILLDTYPPVFPSVETMTDYEELGDPREILIGGTRWTFTDEHGEPEVHALQSGGHSAGGLVFHLPRHRFLMLADETSSVPIWAVTAALARHPRGVCIDDLYDELVSTSCPPRSTTVAGRSSCPADGG